MNKYNIFLISLLILTSFFVFFDEGSEDDSTETIDGIVSDIKQSSNGYTFDVIDSEGKKIHCFNKIEPEKKFITARGSYSDDGSIFFIESLINT